MNVPILSLATALAISTSVAFGDGVKPEFFAGTQVGGTSVGTSYVMQSFDTTDTERLTSHSRDTFWIAGVFAGVRFAFDHFFTGLEVEGMWDDLNINRKIQDNDLIELGPWELHMTRRYQVIPSVILGWSVDSKAKVYAKLGAGISHFSFTEGLGSPTERTKNSTVIHFVPALGIEYEVHDHVGLRLEISSDIAGGKIKVNSGSSNTQSTKADYRAVSVKFGVLVKV